MVEGFSLELEDYCSHCGDFEPVAAFGLNTGRDIRGRLIVPQWVITCKNHNKCARIADNIKKRID